MPIKDSLLNISGGVLRPLMHNSTPDSAQAAGLVDYVLPPGEMHADIEVVGTAAGSQQAWNWPGVSSPTWC